MASLNLDPQGLKAVEHMRQRLSQLSDSLGSLKAQVYTSNTLPDFEALQASADILKLNLQALVDIIRWKPEDGGDHGGPSSDPALASLPEDEAANNYHQVFSRLTVHPSTNFPGRTQENILYQLLRKKAEPDVEAFAEEGRRALHGGGTGAGAEAAAPPKDEEARLERTWDVAADFMEKRVRAFAMSSDDPFTAEERRDGVENVRTGLRRKLDEDEDDEDEDDDEAAAGEAGGNTQQEDDDLVMMDRPPQPQQQVPAKPVPAQPKPVGLSPEIQAKWSAGLRLGSVG